MHRRYAEGLSRREFLGGLTLVGVAGFLGLKPKSLAAEPPPETTRIRLVRSPGICFAPQYVAEEFLHQEGFRDVEYVTAGGTETSEAIAAGRIDIGAGNVWSQLLRIDSGDPIVFLSGLHVGCYELFATGRVRSIRDLKGKTVAVPTMGSGQHLFLASMAAYVGLDPRKHINWLIKPAADSIELLAQEKVDAFMAFPPEPQELRAKRIGYVVVNTTVDRPWSQYFCCTLVGNRDFVREHPVATKRALRAILKAANLCALHPDHTAHLLVDKGFTQRYDYALQTLKEIPYGKWTEYDPEDTVRFYALRLNEVGMIKSSPQKIIAEGTDWRFLNELKQELKG